MARLTRLNREVASAASIVALLCSMTAYAEIVVDNPPTHLGGPAADTAYVLSGAQRWQQVADGFELADSADIRRVTFWGFYGEDNPPGSESIRVRFYDSTMPSGTPGNIILEYSTTDVSRTATGLIVNEGIDPDEYKYEIDLPIPFAASPNIRYWLEIVQLGSVETRFRWEYGPPDNNSFVFKSPSFPEWTSGAPSRLAYQLSTIPEPATIGLLAGGVLWARHRARVSRELVG